MIANKYKTGIVSDPLFTLHNKQSHPECADRLNAILNKLEDEDIFPLVESVEARRAAIDEIELCHSSGYIKKVYRMSKEGGGYLDPDTYVNEHTYNAAVLAAGSLIELTSKVDEGKVKNGFALVRPPGHHALATNGMGFCIFGNVSIAAKAYLKNRPSSKIAIVDFDVHHGNGTQALVGDDPNILFISTHQYPFYPGTGKAEETGRSNAEGTILNIPLPAGTGDKGYTRVYDELVIPKLKWFNPDFIIISAGYDAHWKDPLANMNLSLVGFDRMAKKLSAISDELCNSKIVFALEGGYNLDVLSYAVSNAVKALGGTEGFEDPVGESEAGEPDISSLIKHIKIIHRL